VPPQYRAPEGAGRTWCCPMPAARSRLDVSPSSLVASHTGTFGRSTGPSCAPGSMALSWGITWCDPLPRGRGTVVARLDGNQTRPVVPRLDSDETPSSIRRVSDCRSSLTSAQPCGFPRCTSARGTRRCRWSRMELICARLCSAGTRRCPALTKCRHACTIVQRRARTQLDTHVNVGPPWSVWPDKSSRAVHKARMRDCQERRGGKPLFSWPGCRGSAPLGVQGAKPPPGCRGSAPLVTCRCHTLTDDSSEQPAPSSPAHRPVALSGGRQTLAHNHDNNT
jgi:hypothetical protein